MISQFLSTTRGGGEYMFTEIANLLAQRGHQVWIITHKIKNKDYTKFNPNLKIIFVSSIKHQGGLPPSISKNMRFIFESLWKGFILIRKEKIELIHSNNFSPALTSSILSSLTKGVALFLSTGKTLKAPFSKPAVENNSANFKELKGVFSAGLTIMQFPEAIAGPTL